MAGREEDFKVNLTAADKASKVIKDVATAAENLEKHGDVQVDLTAQDKATQHITELRDKLDALDADSYKVILTADARAAQGDIDKIIAALRTVDGTKAEALITAKNEASAKLDAIQTELNNLNGFIAHTDAQFDSTTAEADIATYKSDKVGSIPTTADTTAEFDYSTAEGDVTDYKDKVTSIPGTETTVARLDDTTARTDVAAYKTYLTTTVPNRESTTIEADTTQAETGLRRVRTAADGIDTRLNGGAGGSGRSVFANFAGNAAQELPGVASAFGPLNMAISQFVEYGTEGDVTFREIAKYAGPIAAIAIGMELVSQYMEAAAKQKAFNAKQVESYKEAIEQVGEGVQAVNLALNETEEISGLIADSSPFTLFGQETKNIVPDLEALGFTIHDVNSVIADTGETMDFWVATIDGTKIGLHDMSPAMIEFQERMEAMGVSGEQQMDILNVLKQNQENYRDSLDDSGASAEFFAHTIDSANDSLDAFQKASDPVKEMPETWRTLGNAIEDGTIATQAGVDAFNAIKEAFPEMSDAEIFQVAADNLDAQTEAAEAAAEAQREDYLSALEETAEQLEENIELNNELAEAQMDTADAALELRSNTRKLADSVDKYEEVMADAESTTREQQDALDSVVESANDLAESEVDAARAQAAANGVTMTSSELLDKRNQSLIRSASTMEGPVRDAILSYIANLNGIPPAKISEIRAAIDRGDLAEAQRLLNEASKTRTSLIRAQTSQWNLNTVKAQIGAAAADKTSRIQVTSNAAEVNRQIDYAARYRSSHIGVNHNARYATGTSSAAAGLALVGEHGPELVSMEGGERVINAGQTEELMRSSQAPSSVVNNNITINAPAGTRPDDVAASIRRQTRIQGPYEY